MSGSATLLRSPACTHGPDFILRSPPPRACQTTHRPTDTPSASTSTRPKHTTTNATPVYVSAVLMEEHYQDLAKLLEEYNQGKITTTAVCSRMPHTTSRLQADDFRVGFGTFQTTFRTENAPYSSIAP